ncbi:MAG: hypothetical protein Q4A84_03495 [Neisseria sp.]|uniref:Spy/CpxP family protein refolding chaperone n=1 Tax=Neisseria sp. TaxID=192066 RepID=UPI0026DA93FE|nr:hypothetical protein [Neisseria sp.]MDO4640753.1 hypothetical protein [Neisseria sp.]
MSVSCFSIVKNITFAALCTLCVSSPVFACNFYPNCDMRSLSLTEEQQKELRQIRIEHRKNIERARQRDYSEGFSRKQDLIRVLSASQFNKQEARRYLQKRYDSDMDIAMEELSVQYKIFQVLNPQQQEKWLSTCTR